MKLRLKAHTYFDKGRVLIKLHKTQEMQKKVIVYQVTVWNYCLTSSKYLLIRWKKIIFHDNYLKENLQWVYHQANENLIDLIQKEMTLKKILLMRSYLW